MLLRPTRSTRTHTRFPSTPLFRATRAVGKAKAMEMVLTGRMMDAAEAERAGLVSRVIPAADLVDEAVKVATVIAAMPPLAVLANKEMVNAAFETNLTQGVQFEIGRASCRERVCQ